VKGSQAHLLPDIDPSTALAQAARFELARQLGARRADGRCRAWREPRRYAGRLGSIPLVWPALAACPERVKMRKTRREQMFSALPQ
jgi:hypothetical protein